MSQTLHRKLAAIICADIAGYSRLMGDDDVATVQTLNAYRELITGLIQGHNGHLLDFSGDSFLAEFVSVVNAVACGTEIQKTIKTKNEQLPDHRKMMFRLGINLGDVVEEDRRIYGDGVNIAARLETIAEAGGICISRPVYDQVKHILDLQYDYLGEHNVKNISHPVWIYRVRLEPTPEPSSKISIEMKRYPLAGEKLTLAVLPFKHISGQEDQETFADSMANDIITGLSKISGLLVTSYNAVSTYKGTPADVTQIGRDLGVRYFLEGSIRKNKDRIRITVQFIDTQTEQNLWTEQYASHIDDRFILQDQIIQKIVAALAEGLIQVAPKPQAPQKIDNSAANEAAVNGWEYVLGFTPHDFTKAIFCFHQSLTSDPENGRALASLAFTYLEGTNLGWLTSLGVSYFEARLRPYYYLDLAMQHPTSLAYLVRAKLKLYLRLYEEAIEDGKHALDLDPNNPIVNSYMGCMYALSGRPMEAISLHRKALTLDADHPALYLYQWGFAHFCMGQMEEAVRIMERARKVNPNIAVYAAPLAAAYAHLGRLDEAVKTLDDYRKTWLVLPKLRWTMFFWPFKDTEIEKTFAEGLIQAKISGRTNGYYKILTEYRLTGNEIQRLVYNRTMIGIYPWSERKEQVYRTRDGNAVIREGENGEIELDKGITIIENDQIFDQWQNRTKGLKIGGPVYRNPEGSPEQFNQYLFFTDFGFWPMSPL